MDKENQDALKNSETELKVKDLQKETNKGKKRVSFVTDIVKDKKDDAAVIPLPPLLIRTL